MEPSQVEAPNIEEIRTAATQDQRAGRRAVFVSLFGLLCVSIGVLVYAAAPTAFESVARSAGKLLRPAVAQDPRVQFQPGVSSPFVTKPIGVNSRDPWAPPPAAQKFRTGTRPFAQSRTGQVTAPYASSVEAEDYVEKASGVMFPSSLEHWNSGTVELVGAGVVKKRFTVLPRKLYSVGLYIGANPNYPEAADALRTLTSKADFDENPDLYKLLLDPKIVKTLRIVTAREVDSKDLAHAISDAMKKNGYADQDKLAAFNKLFYMRVPRGWSQNRFEVRTNTLTRGFEYIFDVEPADDVDDGGIMVPTVNGNRLDRMGGKALSDALFDLYLGEKAIVDRKALVQRLPQVLGSVPESTESVTPQSSAVGRRPSVASLI